jgi:hypothetical protein
MMVKASKATTKTVDIKPPPNCAMIESATAVNTIPSVPAAIGLTSPSYPAPAVKYAPAEIKLIQGMRPSDGTAPLIHIRHPTDTAALIPSKEIAFIFPSHQLTYSSVMNAHPDPLRQRIAAEGSSQYLPATARGLTRAGANP